MFPPGWTDHDALHGAARNLQAVVDGGFEIGVGIGGEGGNVLMHQVGRVDQVGLRVVKIAGTVAVILRGQHFALIDHGGFLLHVEGDLLGGGDRISLGSRTGAIMRASCRM